MNRYHISVCKLVQCALWLSDVANNKIVTFLILQSSAINNGHLLLLCCHQISLYRNFTLTAHRDILVTRRKKRKKKRNDVKSCSVLPVLLSVAFTPLMALCSPNSVDVMIKIYYTANAALYLKSQHKCTNTSKHYRSKLPPFHTCLAVKYDL